MAIDTPTESRSLLIALRRVVFHPQLSFFAGRRASVRAFFDDAPVGKQHLRVQKTRYPGEKGYDIISSLCWKIQNGGQE